MKKVILLSALLSLMINFSLSGASRKLHFEKIGDEYIVWKQLDANRRVNGYVADKEIFTILNYFNPSVNQDYLEKAFLNPEKNIRIRADSCYTYNQKDFFLTKDKLYNDETIIYIPEIHSITNDYNSEKTEGIIAWHMIVFYIGIFLVLASFSLLMNLVMKRWVAYALIVSGLIFLSSFIPALLYFMSWDAAMTYVFLNVIMLFFSGLLTVGGVAFGEEPTTKNQEITNRKQEKNIARFLFSAAILVFLFTAATDFALITKLNVIAACLLSLGVMITIIISLLIYFGKIALQKLLTPAKKISLGKIG